MLEGRGAECLHGPTLRTHPLGPEDEIAGATSRVLAAEPDVTVLNTGIGVRGWFAAADSLLLGEQLLDTLDRSHLVSRGPKACGAAVTAGLTVDWNAQQATTAEVVDYLAERGVRGQTVAVQLDGDPECELIQQIEALGAEVIDVPVYRWTMPLDRLPAQQLIAAICDGRVDAITFTARPAVVNFAQIADDLGRLDEVRSMLGRQTLVFSVGSTTASAVDDVGLGTSTYPDKARLGALVMFLTQSLADGTRTFDLAGRRVELRGRAISVEGRDQELLTGRERQLLEVLIERPGVVHSKDALLAEIWGQSSDHHVVEVTVGRLRRRLGDAGEGIETVMRRGYRAAAA